MKSHSHCRGVLPLLLLLCAALLSTPAGLASERPPYIQALRFAAEGRADLSRLALANGRRADTTVAALGEVASASEVRLHGPASRESESGQWQVQRPPDAVAVLRLLEIPERQRGALHLRFETDDPAIAESTRRAADFLARVVAAAWLPRSEIRVHALPPGESRAHAAGLGGRASIHLRRGVLDLDTAIHELAHHIEGDHRPVLEASKLFLARRARGGAPERLRDLLGDGYRPDEITLRANWSTRGGHHYVGKFYGPSLRQATATEVVSMGLERLHRDPAGFYREDADYFLFLLLALQVGA